MTAPKKWQAIRLADCQGGDVLFSSWLLLLGALPVGRHAFGSFAFTPKTGFVEISSTWVNRLWRHERTLASTESGCVVRDTVSFAPRLELGRSWFRAALPSLLRRLPTPVGGESLGAFNAALRAFTGDTPSGYQRRLRAGLSSGTLTGQ